MIPSRGAAIVAAVLGGVTVALAVCAALRPPIGLPVIALLGGAPVRLATVWIVPAVLVPPALVAVIAAIRATGRLERSTEVLALGAASPIVLVLVLRLNGAADAAALVLGYAGAAGGVLIRSLQRPGGDPLAFRWAAVLGIVPWGVVAFTQVGGLLTGTPPSVVVRVLTVLVLAASLAQYVVSYRHRDDPVPIALGLALIAAPGVLLGAVALLV